MKYLMLFAILFSFDFSSAMAESNLPEEMLVTDSDISIEYAKEQIDKINIALGDFILLTDIVITDKCRSEINEKEECVAKISAGNINKISKSIDWRTQNYKFQHWYTDVKGALLKLDSKLKSAEYELANIKKEKSKDDLAKFKLVRDKAVAEYNNYLKNSVYID